MVWLGWKRNNPRVGQVRVEDEFAGLEGSRSLLSGPDCMYNRRDKSSMQWRMAVRVAGQGDLENEVSVASEEGQVL